jgi:hypothetical protein
MNLFTAILWKKCNCVIYHCEKTEMENRICVGGAVYSKSHKECC